MRVPFVLAAALTVARRGGPPGRPAPPAGSTASSDRSRTICTGWW